MARIELRDAYVYMKDNLSGTFLVNEPVTPPAIGDTEFDVDTVSLNTADTDLIPVGARFTVNSGDGTVYTVTARTPSGTGPTTNIVFTPALTETLANNDQLDATNQQILITVGEGNVTWTESKEYNYYLDRGDLDTVAEGDQQPCEVSIDMTYEHVTTGTSEDITPVDALKQTGSASEWVSVAADACEPYAINITIEHITPCGTAQDERIVFTPFRWDSLDFDLSEATISMTGRINAVSPTVTRGDYS